MSNNEQQVAHGQFYLPCFLIIMKQIYIMSEQDFQDYLCNPDQILKKIEADEHTDEDLVKFLICSKTIIPLFAMVVPSIGEFTKSIDPILSYYDTKLCCLKENVLLNRLDKYIITTFPKADGSIESRATKLL